jgi:hypothetical protein
LKEYKKIKDTKTNPNLVDKAMFLIQRASGSGICPEEVCA